jgi:O2-independent ubiquinone biosynthesis accessory factor UbiT
VAIAESILGHILTGALRRVGRRHPGFFDRLTEWDGEEILIDPDGLPFGLVVTLRGSRSKIRLVTHPDQISTVATIRGSAEALLDLLEGRADGDALFFSRRLSIEGSMDVVVGLRNALDADTIELPFDALPMPPGRLRHLHQAIHTAARPFATVARAMLIGATPGDRPSSS